jgi:hypothetical protein
MISVSVLTCEIRVAARGESPLARWFGDVVALDGFSKVKPYGVKTKNFGIPL